MTLQADIEALVATHLTAWNARDFEGMAALYSEPTAYVVPSGALALPDRDALISRLREQFAAMEADGFDHTEIASVSARQCNEATAIVDLKNVARLRADGSALEITDAVASASCKTAHGASASQSDAGQTGATDRKPPQ